MTPCRAAAIMAASTLFAFSLPSAPPAFAAPFDGQWSVQVIVKSGRCETGYLLPIRVTGGRVSYSGQINTIATGEVGDGGQVAVRFIHGRDVVDATGALKGRSGSGRWTSNTLRCTGTWIADRG